MFDSYLEEINQIIINRGGKTQDIPIGLAECISANKKSVIKSWLWKVPGFRRWRVTRLDGGEAIQVLNSVAYPEVDNDQPLMGIDILWFGKTAKLVAVLDFQPLMQNQSYFDRHFQGLKSLHKKFPSFSNQSVMRSFDPHQYFSPWLLFCRGGREQLKTTLPELFTSFLMTYLIMHDAHNEYQSQIYSKDVMRLQVEYDKYCADRDPAHGLFTSYFGKNWSDQFLKEFLFPGCYSGNTF